MRIVSLLPSATEILFAVGAGDAVVGVTFECDFPDEARQRRVDAEVKARLAAGEDLYTLDEGALRDIDPTLVVTQDLCAVCAVDITEVDQALEHLGCRAEVLTLDPMTLGQVLDSIEAVGRATGHEDVALTLRAQLERRLDAVARAVRGRDRPRMALLEWTDPPFSSGHWVPDLVEAAGARSVLGQSGARSSQITWDDLHAAAPEVIVVVPCGYRLDGARLLTEELVAHDALPIGIPVWAVDADAAFVRPGPRVIDGVETLAAIAHPEVLNGPDGMATLVRPAN
jgi:iron complex transport system substrate-binding protein